jgi:hypothetical protein
MIKIAVTYLILMLATGCGEDTSEGNDIEGDKKGLIFAAEDFQYRLIDAPNFDRLLSAYVDQPNISVCLDPLDSGANVNKFAEWIESAIAAWISPMQEFASLPLTNDITVHTYPCPDDPLAIYYVQRNLDDTCINDDNRACATVSQDPIKVVNHIDDGYSVVLHETGHLFGFDDLYYKLDEEGGRVDTKHCVDPYFETIMCQREPALLQADFFGAQKLYCSLFDDPNCIAPTTISPDMYPKMISCKDQASIDGLGSNTFNVNVSIEDFEPRIGLYSMDNDNVPLEPVEGYLNLTFRPRLGATGTSFQMKVSSTEVSVEGIVLNECSFGAGFHRILKSLEL